jgi:trk system potassium uptake protein TrkA
MRILIVGAGDIGFQLSKRLFRERTDVTLVEGNPARAQRAREQLDAIVVEGHGCSARALDEAGVEHADLVAAMTDNDEVNILSCQLAKRRGVRTTVARVRNPEFMLPDYPVPAKELGVDHFIHPEKETADSIVRLIRQAQATDVVEFENGKIVLLGLRLEEGSPLLRKPLHQLAQEFGDPPLRIVAVNRQQHTMIPRGDDEMIRGDQVFAICKPDYVSSFVALTGKADIRIEDVMILGGGLVGQFVARELSKTANVKLVESNVERSREIANILPDTLIIHGDGTDIDLMAVEALQDMDAFVAVTGDDETNIISTLLARHLKVKRTIALVNKIEYLPITPGIGMDAVVSKQLLTVNAVHRFIEEQEVAAIASVPGVNASIIEYIVDPEDKITRKPLKDITFPHDAIVGALMRGDEYMIPVGSTRFQAGDRVVVFTLSNALSEVDKLFK